MNNLEPDAMGDKIYNVLFLSTQNSARSIMAEAILNHVGNGRFRAFSAGSHPALNVNPNAIAQLRIAKMSYEKLHCKNWNEFTSSEAPEFDFVFTLCDTIKLEDLPVLKGHPVIAHWSVDDPNEKNGTSEEMSKIFLKVFSQINWRISIFASLPLKSLSAMRLKIEMDNISRLEDRRVLPRI